MDFNLSEHTIHNLCELPVLILLRSLSGAGKTSLNRKFLEQYGDRFELAVSHTTRPKRFTESHGNDYYFISQDEFEEMIKKDKFIEHADVYGKKYGTSLGRAIPHS